MTPSKTTLHAFYDGPIDIGLTELDRIVQGLLWVGDKILLPSYARPSWTSASEERALVAKRLGELAEEGCVVRWNVESMPTSLSNAPWWPSKSSERTLPHDGYSELQARVTEGVQRHKADLARGLGRKPGAMVSGVAELVSLRETLYTIGVARYFSADVLVSTEARSALVAAPLKMLKRAEAVNGPITRKLLELHGIAGLELLSTRDIKKLRKRSAPVRAFVEKVSRVSEGNEPFVAAGEVEELQREVAIEEYVRCLVKAQRGERRKKLRASAGDGAITIAGMTYPPLALAGFAAALMRWKPSRDVDRQLLVFMSKLQKRNERAKTRNRRKRI
jgi:hypothetical protein